jgi:hypothetical protein
VSCEVVAAADFADIAIKLVVTVLAPSAVGEAAAFEVLQRWSSKTGLEASDGSPGSCLLRGDFIIL